MKKVLFLSIFSAILATTCCLGAFIFLITGLSFSILSNLEFLNNYRWIFSGLSIVCLVLYTYLLFKNKNKCEIKNKSKSKVLIFTLAILSILFLLTYPEILGILI